MVIVTPIGMVTVEPLVGGPEGDHDPAVFHSPPNAVNCACNLPDTRESTNNRMTIFFIIQ